MLYEEHIACKAALEATQGMYYSILSEKENLFALVMPKSVRTDKIQTNGGDRVGLFDVYLDIKERSMIDERLCEARDLLERRSDIAKLKESEVRASRDFYDRVYVGYFLDKWPISIILNRTNYSRAQLFRIVGKIRKKMRLYETVGVLKYQCGIVFDERCGQFGKRFTN